jgi:hypothetical protein
MKRPGAVLTRKPGGRNLSDRPGSHREREEITGGLRVIRASRVPPLIAPPLPGFLVWPRLVLTA